MTLVVYLVAYCKLTLLLALEFTQVLFLIGTALLQCLSYFLLLDAYYDNL